MARCARGQPPARPHPGAPLTVLAEAALPAPAAIAAEVTEAIDARAVFAARAGALVLRGLACALITVCGTWHDDRLEVITTVSSLPNRPPAVPETQGLDLTHQRTWTRRLAVERGGSFRGQPVL